MDPHGAQLDVGNATDIVSVSGSNNVLTFSRRDGTTQDITVGITQEQVYQHAEDIITAGTGITVVDSDSDNTITISVTNEFTDADETKLDGIAEGAEVNVQADWNITDVNSDAHILNKPTIPAAQIQSDWTQTTTTALDYIQNKPDTSRPTKEEVYDHSVDIITAGTGITVVDNDTDNTITISVSNEFTDAEKTKLTGIATGAEVNVKADWNITDVNSDAHILNKPTVIRLI